MSKKIYIGPTIDGIAIRNTVYEELPEPLEKRSGKTRTSLGFASQSPPLPQP